MSLLYKLQGKNRKKIYKIIIINLSIIFFFGYFSFKLLPKILLAGEYDYENVSIYKDKFESINYVVAQTTRTSSLYFIKDYKKFLNDYFNFIRTEPENIYNSHCPPEILESKMRAIQIYFKKKYEFNVRFHVNKFSSKKNIVESKINKCFNFIFIEHLNKFFKNEFYYFLEGLEIKLFVLNDFNNFNNSNNFSNFYYNDDIKSKNLINYFKNQKFESDLYFVNPNQTKNLNFSASNTIWTRSVSFIILLVTTLIIQVFYKKYKKKILVFFNKIK